MHAFDYVMTLLSFVYALAIAHVLATLGDIIGAWKRVRFSWLNAAWMLYALFGVLAWWIGLWGWHQAGAWRMQDIAIFFVLAAILYLQTRLVCARIPEQGAIDLQAFHALEGKKYMGFYTALAAATVGVNVYYARQGVADVIAKNEAVLAMFGASLVGTLFANRWIQIAVATVLAGLWMWYFATLQGALS